MKREVSAVISQDFCPTWWRSCRKVLASWREAIIEEDLEILWGNLLDTWFKEKDRQKRAKSHSRTYIWKKKAIGGCYSKECLTLEYSPAQHAEYWHSSLCKCREQTNIIRCFQKVRAVYNRQVKKRRSQDLAVRVYSSVSLNYINVTRLSKKIQELCLSRRAKELFSTELSASFSPKIHFFKWRWLALRFRRACSFSTASRN